MEFFEVINKRHMYRGNFESTKVEKKDIELMLGAALKSPQAVNEPTTSYVVVTDKTLINKIGALLPMNGTSTAPLIIVVLSEEVITEKGGSYEIENYIAATENLMLAITALGYSTVWTDGITRIPAINNGVREILNVPKKFKIRAILPVGRELEKTFQKPKPFYEQRVISNKFEVKNGR
ncbi:nitroreductase family protein [Crassaminicella profunda]|uniref:nitroreductase family protein n=1 Tax=Crassaminicella profunda TaxID=1286698 RepID=UPI001CA62C82|nr:nitroreductase family protein [Crassaminicella profunda]QZY56054.1 nitroreductase family protein [Crassaminicella profunda]